MNIRDLQEQSGMSLADLSRYLNIPYRTIQHWAHETRECPAYVLELIEFKLKTEGYIK